MLGLTVGLMLGAVSAQPTESAAPAASGPAGGLDQTPQPGWEEPKPAIERVEPGPPISSPAPVVGPTPAPAPAVQYKPLSAKPPSIVGPAVLYALAPLAIGAAVPIQLKTNEIYRRECLDNLTDEDGGKAYRCTASLDIRAPLRLASGVLLAASVGMAAGGGALHGRRRAHLDIASGRPALKTSTMAAVGFPLLGLGAATLFGLRLGMMIGIRRCDSLECLERRQTIALVGTDVSILLMGAGAALGLYGLSYQRYEKSMRVSALSFAPTISPQFRGMSFSGKF